MPKMRNEIYCVSKTRLQGNKGLKTKSDIRAHLSKTFLRAKRERRKLGFWKEVILVGDLPIFGA